MNKLLLVFRCPSNLSSLCYQRAKSRTLNRFFCQRDVRQKCRTPRRQFAQCFLYKFRAYSQQIQKRTYILQIIKRALRCWSRLVAILIRLVRYPERCRCPGNRPVNPECSFTCNRTAAHFFLPFHLLPRDHAVCHLTLEMSIPSLAIS